MGTYPTISNQRKILAHAQSSRLIFLQPVPPWGCGGNIEHYYHFIFDLVLPLYFVVKQTPPDVIFVLEDFGIYTDRLHDLFPHRIKIAHDIDIPKNTKRIHLIGMNPKSVHSRHDALESFKRDICSNLKVDQTGEPNKVLLIERSPMDPYFMTSSKIRGGGTSRRSILNHGELTSTIRSMVRAPFEFHNLQLENISLKEQIHYFDRALIVVGQHGAGLANCVWMRRKSIVIELSSNESRQEFRIISKLKHHHYYWYKTSGPHPLIDVDDFVNWVLRDTELGSFFHK